MPALSLPQQSRTISDATPHSLLQRSVGQIIDETFSSVRDAVISPAEASIPNGSDTLSGPFTGAVGTGFGLSNGILNGPSSGGFSISGANFGASGTGIIQGTVTGGGSGSFSGTMQINSFDGKTATFSFTGSTSDGGTVTGGGSIDGNIVNAGPPPGFVGTLTGTITFSATPSPTPAPTPAPAPAPTPTPSQCTTLADVGKSCTCPPPDGSTKQCIEIAGYWSPAPDGSPYIACGTPGGNGVTSPVAP